MRKLEIKKEEKNTGAAGSRGSKPKKIKKEAEVISLRKIVGKCTFCGEDEKPVVESLGMMLIPKTKGVMYMGSIEDALTGRVVSGSIPFFKKKSDFGEFIGIDDLKLGHAIDYDKEPTRHRSKICRDCVKQLSKLIK